MRCYFMRGSHIFGVHNLNATEDAGRIEEANVLFRAKGVPKGADGFEVWDGPRFVYRYPKGQGRAEPES